MIEYDYFTHSQNTKEDGVRDDVGVVLLLVAFVALERICRDNDGANGCEKNAAPSQTACKIEAYP